MYKFGLARQKKNRDDCGNARKAPVERKEMARGGRREHSLQSEKKGGGMVFSTDASVQATVLPRRYVMGAVSGRRASF